MGDVVPMGKLSVAEWKAELTAEALRRLQSAHALDERDGLDVASLVAWYDATAPDVTSIKVLSGLMLLEFRKRRGERLLQEGERRGGAQGKVKQRLTLPGVAKVQRHEDRVLAEQPEAVKAYGQQEVKAGRVPSVRGAVRAAKAARATKAPKVNYAATTTPVPYAEGIRHEVRQLIERVNGQSLTLEELAERWGGVHTDSARRYLREVACLGEVVKDGDRYTVTATNTMATLEAFGLEMHTEVQKRRKEARDKYQGWRPDNIHTANQSALLDWIEDRFYSLVPKFLRR